MENNSTIRTTVVQTQTVTPYTSLKYRVEDGSQTYYWDDFVNFLESIEVEYRRKTWASDTVFITIKDDVDDFYAKLFRLKFP